MLAWRRSDVVLHGLDSICLVVHMTDFEFRKLTSQADSRMRSRTAKEQLEAVLRELQREQKDSIPDADDESAQRDRVLT